MHLIRIRGPWQLECAGLDNGGRVFDWTKELQAVLTEAQEIIDTNEVRLLRRFNAPTGIGSKDCVALVIAGLGSPAVYLNGNLLAAHELDSARFVVSALLQPQNQLVIAWGPRADLEFHKTGDLPAVCLEITSSSPEV